MADDTGCSLPVVDEAGDRNQAAMLYLRQRPRHAVGVELDAGSTIDLPDGRL